MKKHILIVCTLLLSIVACKKDDPEPEPEAKKTTIYDTTKVIDRHVDSIYHHFYDTTKVIDRYTDSIYHHFYDTTKLTVYDTVRVPIISDHSWIIYIHNNGTDDVDTVDIKNGTYTNIKSDLTRYGYDLVKWSTSPTGGGSEYTPGDSYYVDNDITLYAIWQSHDGLHDYEVYDFLAKQSEGSTVDIKIIDLNPDFSKIQTALDKFWKIKVNLNLDDATEVTFFSVLANCTNILSITLPPNLKELGILLPNITSLKIPETVEKLYFSNCQKLEQIKIPESVTFLGISQCAFKSLSIPNSVKQIEQITECPNLTEITIPESVESMYMHFGGCTNLKTVKHSLKECSGVDFGNCKNLTSISLPEFRPENPTINNAAFSDCTSLTSITIPEGVTSIGDNAFFGCTSLTSITIPESVTSIGSLSFWGCTSLTSLKIESTTPPYLSGWIGYSGTIYVPSSAVNAYKTADVWKDHADQIVGY